MILESFRAGLAFLPRAWSRPWFMAFVAAAVALGLAAAMSGDGTRWLPPVILLVAFLYPPLAQGPLYALALPDTGRSDGLARYGRLLAVNLLTILFLAVPALLLSVVGLGVAYGMAFAHPGFDPKDAATWTSGGPVLLGGGAVVVMSGLTLLWLWSRVSLGPAASVTERRVIMLSSWPLTRGLGWRIAVTRLVLLAVALLVVLLVRSVVPATAPTRTAAVVCDILFVAIGLPVEIGVLSFYHARRSPLPVTP